MNFFNEQLLINLIKASGKDYLTNEEINLFKKYYEWQNKQNFLSYNLDDGVKKINETMNYPLIQFYQSGIYLSNLAMFNQLVEDIKFDNSIITDYFKYLTKLTRYVVFPIKDFVNAFGYIEEKTFYYIVVKAYILEKNIKYYPNIQNKYQILFSNPGIDRLNQEYNINLPNYIMERWLDEINVDKVFNFLTNAIKEKENQNNLLKLKMASQYYLSKEKESQKFLVDYATIQTKYDKLEKLIFDKQINIKLMNNNNNNKRVRKL